MQVGATRVPGVSCRPSWGIDPTLSDPKSVTLEGKVRGRTGEPGPDHMAGPTLGYGDSRSLSLERPTPIRKTRGIVWSEMGGRGNGIYY